VDLQLMKLRLKRLLCPPEVCVGSGSVERLGCLEPARVLVVTGSSAGRTRILERVTAQLRNAIAREVMEAGGEPRVATLEAARAAVTAFAPEWIVAVGGGAVLDSAKFLWAQFECPDLVLSGSGPLPIGPLRRKARLIAVPTTAGSGSEASQAAVLTGEDGTKIPYVSEDWVPDVAILDPLLTVSLPPELTVSTGFDALTHAVESAVSSLGNTLLCALAASAVRLLLRHLPAAVENPKNLRAREALLEAAFLAGLSQSTASTGAAHALSHATSKLRGTPHGAGTGFYLLPTMRWNRAKCATVYDELAAGCGFADGSALVAALTDLAARVRLPQTFAELLGSAPDAAEREALADVAAKDACLRTNVCRLGTPELVQVVSEIR